MRTLAALFDAHRPWVALALVALTLVAGFGVSRATFDDNLRNLFRADDDAVDLLEDVYEEFGGYDGDVLLLARAPDVFEPAPLRALQDAADRAAGVEGVESVVSARDISAPGSALGTRSLLPAPDADLEERDAAKRAALDHPLVAGRLISRDTTTAMVIARIARERTGVSELRDPVADLRAIAREVGAAQGVEMGVTGVPVVRVDAIDTLVREQKRFLAIGTLAGMLVALAIFRRLAPVLVVTAGALLGVVWTVGLLGLVGEPVNAVSSVIPTIVLVVGFTDGVHLLHEARRGIASGASPREAAREALATVGPACLFAALTTGIGFASLTLARLEVIQRFGVAAAVGAMLTFVTVNTAVPLLCSAPPLARRLVGSSSREPNVWERATRSAGPVLFRRARLFAGAGIALTIGVAAGALTTQPNSSLAESLPQHSPAVQWLHRADDAFGGVLRVIAVVESEDPDQHVVAARREIERVADVMRAEQALTEPFTVFDLLSLVPVEQPDPVKLTLLSAAAPQLVSHYLDPEGKRTLVVSAVPDVGMAQLEPTFQRLMAGLREIDEETPAVSVALTGDPIAIGRNSNRMIGDLSRSLGVAGVIIFVVISASLRSFRLGLISVIPNVLPLVSATALLALLGWPFNVTAIVSLCVCLGIAVDDSIHFLSRYQIERSRGASTEEAIQHALEVVGAALAATTAVLVLGGGAPALSDMPILRTFGVLLATGLTTAFLADVLFLPALVACFDRGTGRGEGRGATGAPRDAGVASEAAERGPGSSGDS